MFLSPCATEEGYLKVGLHKDGTRKNFYVHRLVAEAYIPNPEGLPQVNHKDENKENCCVNNLEWMSVKENSNYGTRGGRIAKALAKPVYCVELNRTFDGARVAARELGLYQTNITACCRGRR